MNIIDIHNIHKSYGDKMALNNVSFNVKKSELFGLIGPDGAGKTTLFRILISLLLPNKGEISMMGKSVLEHYKALRLSIGYMPGKFSLYEDLSVEENLNFYATIFGTSIEENYHLIEGIYKQIEMFKTRKAGNLSGGMKQKLALCCALIHNPKIIVLDEPTTGVDAVSRKEFWEMLKSLREQEITVLVSTPYMDEASKCDRVALIQNGEIMKVNSPQQIEKEFEGNLFEISSENQYHLKNNLNNIFGEKSAYLFGQNIHLTIHDKEISEEKLTKIIAEKGVKISEIIRINANIEDCFMQLMQS